MNVLKQIFTDPSVVAVVSGLVAWLVAHRVGLVKVLTRWVAVLENGNISVQQVKDTVQAVDPTLYAELQAKLKQYESEAEADANAFEAKVQAAAAAKLQEFIGKLQSVPLPDAPVPVEAPVEAPPAG